MVAKDTPDKEADEKEADQKEVEKESPSTEQPLIIQPDETKPDETKPVMPELKGEPEKRIKRVKKPRERGPGQEQSKLVTFILLVSFILLAGGMTVLVFPILDKPLPGWMNPVMNVCRNLPLFPGEKKTEEKPVLPEEAPAEEAGESPAETPEEKAATPTP